MEKMSGKKKNTFIDYLKGIAIILVLVGHCVQYGSGASFLEDGEYWNNIVMKVIYSFHMPLFIAVSGYLFKKSWDNKWYKKTYRKAATCLFNMGNHSKIG